MPIYYSEIAPNCPISRDQVPAASFPPPRMRTNLPKAVDLPSAINVANIARSIVTSLVFNRTINNIYNVSTPKPPKNPKPKKSRWSEDRSKRITRRYKYYLKDESGEEDTEAWVETERIERMVWVDRSWQVSLTWIYGDKGEGDPVSSARDASGQETQTPEQ